MKNKVYKSWILAMMAATFSAFGLSAHAADSKDSIQLTDITAITSVGDEGEMVEAFKITVADEDLDKLQNLTAEDIEVTGNNSGGMEAVDFEDDGVSVSLEGNTLTINIAQCKMTDTITVSAESIDGFSFSGADAEYENYSIADFEELSYTAENGVTLNYRLRDGSSDDQPLVIWMHGAGECGTDNRIHITANRGATAFAEYTEDAYVIAAQYPEKYSTPFLEGEEESMEEWLSAYTELIETMVDEGKIDANRIYLTGASMGGGLVLRYMTDYPDLFAGVVAMCSRGTINENLDVLEEVVDLPIWLFHADSDFVNPSTNSKEVYEKLVELGSENVKLTIFSDEDLEKLNITFSHGIWTAVLKDMEMMDWLFSLEKN